MVQRPGANREAAVAQGCSNRRCKYQFLSQTSPSRVHVNRSSRHAVRSQEDHRGCNAINAHSSLERIRNCVKRLSQVAAHQPFDQSIFIICGGFGSSGRRGQFIDTCIDRFEHLDGRQSEFFRSASIPAKYLRGQVADKLFHLIPSEFFQQLREKAQKGQIFDIAQKERFECAFIQQRNDPLVMSSQPPQSD